MGKLLVPEFYIDQVVNHYNIWGELIDTCTVVGLRLPYYDYNGNFVYYGYMIHRMNFYDNPMDEQFLRAIPIEDDVITRR